jgi:hypothetical protein
MTMPNEDTLREIHAARANDYVVVTSIKRKEGSTRPKEWRWTRKSANHLKVAGSQEGYQDHDYTVAMAKAINPGLPVQDPEGNPL